MNDIVYSNQHKTFLSDATSEFSSIAWSVTLQSSDPANSWIWSEIRLTDCARPITISMGLTVQSDQGITEETRRTNIDQRMAKIDRLIHELEQYREAYCTAIQKGEELALSNSANIPVDTAHSDAIL